MTPQYQIGRNSYFLTQWQKMENQVTDIVMVL